MRYLCLALLNLILLFSFGCSQEEIVKKHVSNEEIAFAKHYFSLFADKNYEEIVKPLSQQLVTENLHSQLVQVAQLFPVDNPRDIKLIGWKFNSSTNKHKQISLTFQYEFPSSWLLATITYERDEDGNFIVNGVNVSPIQESYVIANKFTFVNKSLVHYIFSLLGAAVLIFVIITFCYYLRTPIKKGKWLWAVFILLGFVQVSLNWTSGLVHIKPLYVQLLGVGFSAQGTWDMHGPWMINLSVPLGAILFWIRRSKWIKAVDDSTDQSGDGKSIENSGSLTE